MRTEPPAVEQVRGQLQDRVQDYTLWQLFMEAHREACGAAIRD